MPKLIKISSSLLSSAIVSDYAGYDPFDSLNSKIFKGSFFYKYEWLRLAWIQLGKRSPINLRRFFLVPKMRNPKGIGLFINGLLEDYARTNDQYYLDHAKKLSDWLIVTRSNIDEWGHSCWGYNFDWQARAFYVPAYKPNIISTCYISKALFELGKVTNNERLIETALDSAHFIKKHLLTKDKHGSFYAYIPGESAFVHNASLWGAAWCAFAGKQLEDSELREQSFHVACRSVREQSVDGSWKYGNRHHHQFIDGFHTGYNLEALKLLSNTLETNDFAESIEKGYNYYLNTFFTNQGTVKYYNNSIYPLDMHSFSQAIITLIKVGGRTVDFELCDLVIRRAIELLYSPKEERFNYQRTRIFTNGMNYIRWSQAWAYYAFSLYNRHRTEVNHATN